MNEMKTEPESEDLYRYVFQMINEMLDDENTSADTIPTKHMPNALRLVGRTPSEFELKKIVSPSKHLKTMHQNFLTYLLLKKMNEIDPHSKGEIKFDQFNAYMLRTLPKTDAKEELRQAFQVFDTNNFGFINLYELRSALQNLGENMSDSEFFEMVKGSNLVRDGRVYYDGKTQFCYFILNLNYYNLLIHFYSFF